MIKKIIPILLLLTICGCTSRIYLNNQLTELGYSEEDISLLIKYDYTDVKIFCDSYNKDLLKIFYDERFNDKYIKEYTSYYSIFDADTLFEIINNNYFEKYDAQLLEKIITDKYFILDNLDNYIEYSNDIKDISKLVGYVNAKAYKKPYVELLIDRKEDEMDIIANKWNYLGKYVPSNLVVFDRKYGLKNYDQQLKQETYDAFVKMYEAAKKDKINIYITSGYRDYNYQVNLYNKYLKTDPREVVDTYSSRPGFSDHQTGLAVDILSTGYDFDTFESSKAFTWLSENAHKFGFILRYPKNKEEITGYMYESWHYRYVGEGVAEYIKENNLTYEEYYAYFIERGLTYESA